MYSVTASHFKIHHQAIMTPFFRTTAKFFPINDVLEVHIMFKIISNLGIHVFQLSLIKIYLKIYLTIYLEIFTWNFLKTASMNFLRLLLYFQFVLVSNGRQTRREMVAEIRQKMCNVTTCGKCSIAISRYRSHTGYLCRILYSIPTCCGQMEHRRCQCSEKYGYAKIGESRKI